ncbi:Gldg family protein [Chelatococcus sambhunathii]|uniref:Gldg family protein n=1 Tax=Chelatococcus sambhunathii TaxID=363953 RepID=A0ABU1DBJ7_9HYPH|nr:Gldg family protein [Chelatococcus sambhunathii]MDR4305487.1 Gldg family protein [Chelatococcus sambhunathii]
MTSPLGPSWPAAVGAVFRHQLRLLAHSRLTLVFQLAFLIALSTATFLIGDFFAADDASLDPMLGFLPWIALVFIPALAMKAFTNRSLDRERELLLTLPLPPGAIAVGGWLAGSVVLLITLAFTAPLAATILWLGAPDIGAMASGYVGAAFLLVSFYAVGLFASAVARSETGAFTIALAILFALMMTGWDGLGRIAPNASVSQLFDGLESASPKFWMERVAAGRFELKALLFFAGVIALALLGTRGALQPRRTPGLRAAVRLSVGAALGAAAISAAVAGAPSDAVDLTASRKFTLSPSTLEIAAGLPKGARVDLYWSRSLPGVPQSVRAHAAQVAELLRLIAGRSGGRLVFEEHDAIPGSEGEAPAVRAGVRRMPLSSGDALFFGASFTSGDRSSTIPYFDQRREGLLEYDVATNLAGLVRSRTPRVGVVTPLIPSSDASATEGGFNAIGELRRGYDVAIIPAFSDRLPDGLDAVIVMGATFLKREMLYSIDQAVMRGAGLIVMIDPRLRLSPSSEKATPYPSADVDDISDLLARYGVNYLGDQVVGDMALAIPVADAAQRIGAFPYWMRFGENQISRTHAVTAGLRDLLLIEPGAFSAPDASALIRTTENAGAAPGRELESQTPATAADGFRPGGGARVVAAEVEGPFSSAFSGHPEAPATKHLERSASSSAVFAIGDVDWILDPFAYEEQTDPQAPRRPRNDNVALFLNMVERAAGGGDLIKIRSRTVARHPLVRVAEIARSLPEEDRAARAAAMARIAEIEKRIAALPAAANVVDLSQLPADVQTRVQQLRDALAPDRMTVRAVDQRERQAVEVMRSRVIAANLVAGPALALAFAAFVAARRRRAKSV